jgi:hypothetical protein
MAYENNRGAHAILVLAETWSDGRRWLSWSGFGCHGVARQVGPASTLRHQGDLFRPSPRVLYLLPRRSDLGSGGRWFGPTQLPSSAFGRLRANDEPQVKSG